MKLITISGIDGSGKSTQAQLLKDYLESQGKRVFYFHAIDFGIANKILGKKKDSGGREISIKKAGWLKIFLRKIALHIDLLRFKMLLNKLSNKNYDYMLSDRYFYDTVININYLSLCHSRLDPESPEILNQVQDDRWVKKVIKPDFAIYLQTDPDKIIQRDCVPDQGLNYLKKKKELFDGSIEKYNLKVINGDRIKEEIFNELKNLIS